MDTIDKLIEDWAKARTESTRVGIDAPLEGFEGFSLSPKADPTPLDAAKAVREAVIAKGGRRPKVDYWKPVAAKVLGISRLFQKRWQAVLDAGIEAGLLAIDSDSLKHPFLVAPEITPVRDPVTEVTETTPKVTVSDVDVRLPDDWTSPVTLKCGHMNWPHNGLTPDDPKQVAAREDGHCCARVAETVANARRLNPDVRGSASVTVNWRVKGLYEPVPVSQRRSVEREGRPGWPGLCCDPETGLYIGGTGNNCRFGGSDARCVVHGPRK